MKAHLIGVTDKECLLNIDNGESMNPEPVVAAAEQPLSPSSQKEAKSPIEAEDAAVAEEEN